MRKTLTVSFMFLLSLSVLLGQFAFTVLPTVTVATAGTKQQLTSDATHGFARMIRIVADNTNTGVVFVGDTDVSSTEWAERLGAGEGFSITMHPPDTFDATDIYLDVSVSTDGVYWSIIF